MTMMRRILAVLFAVFLAGAALADDLAQPDGDVVLTITGAIAHHNDTDAARFDLAMLDALPQRETVTENPWYAGVQTFTGPQFSDLMQAVGAEGSALRVIAINDYSAIIPWEDVADLPIILACVTLLRGVSLPLALAVAVVLCFAAAELFYRYVEQPAQRLSVAAGRAVDRRVARNRRGQTPVVPDVAPEAATTSAASVREREPVS